jgi:hypothetical protein
LLDPTVLNEGSEPVVLKHFVNAFRETNLRALLEQRSITDLVVVGSMSHMCIDGVVRAAADLGYKVTVFMAALGDIEVVMAHDLEFRQQRIAVVAMGIDGIAPVGELRPDAVGEELVLRHVRPVTEALGVAFVGAVDFLEEHHVGAHAAHRFTQLGQDETSVQGSEALVDIDRQHREASDGDAGGDGHPVGDRSHDCSCGRSGGLAPCLWLTVIFG